MTTTSSSEPACHELVAYLLEHLPAGVRLLVATRSEPPLRLASLRVAGQLAEIRADDLRLTAEEAASFVRDTEGLPLDDAELALLTARTEGWVAAIHLAVLWLRAQPDQRAALLEFAGDNRHLVDYLGEQVLAALDPDVERFLLETSILTRFSAPLCDAVTGRGGAAESLAGIERANLFLVPLDGRRQWYRYHHLFGGLLQAELATAIRTWCPSSTGARTPGTASTARSPRPSTMRPSPATIPQPRMRSPPPGSP